MNKLEQLLGIAKMKIANLSFEECEEIYDKIEKGNPMIDLLFDRMEEIDEKRFEKWLG